MTVTPPLSYMAGSGSRSADLLQDLAWGFSGICLFVVLAIAVLIGMALLRSRRRRASQEGNAIGGGPDGLALIWWGVGLSVPVLIAMAAWSFLVTRSLAEAPRGQPMTIEVTAHRWWWEIRYLNAGLPPVTTANELVMPAGVPVRLQLASSDVIHDFWVPKLGPKMDMVPGRTNQTWLQADRAGVYRGQCAEYCGLQHAHMAFLVRAMPAASFARWLSHEQEAAAGTASAPWDLASPGPAEPSPAVAASTGPATAAPPEQALFLERCAACHTVRGSGAGGILGPDLTHFASRSTLAAGTLPNTPSALDRWLGATQAVKPGAMMPQVSLRPEERAALVRYLEGLS